MAAEFCGAADFPTAERAMPHMIRRAATRKKLILASGIRKKGYSSHIGKSNMLGAFFGVADEGVALPLICSAYVGVAEAAAEKALASAKRKGTDGVNVLVIGEMQTELTAAQIALESRIANVDELNAEPGIEHADRSLIRKTIVTEAVKRTADKAIEAAGGSGYFRAFGLERILRDAQAAQFHPMPAKKQHLFTGRLAMGYGSR